MKNYDVILIRPKIGMFKTYKTDFPPFAYLFLAPILAKNGYEVKVFDQQVEKKSDLVALLKKHSPLWIGLTTVTGPTITTGLETAQLVRSINPDVPIVWGGPHPTVLPEQTAKHDLVDIVVKGEGERTVVELTKVLDKGGDLETVNGIVFKKGGTVHVNKDREFITDWDSEVELDWTYIDINKYINHVGGFKNLPIITSRGCPYRCAFCWTLLGYKQNWNGWSAENTIKEIEKILSYGIDYVTFQDDNFAVNIDRLKKIAKYLQQQNIKWSADNGFRVGRHIDIDLMETLKKSNCDHVAFGAESGSQRILNFIHKGISIDQIVDSAKVTDKVGMGAKYTWMIGFPTETKEEIFMTLNLIDKIKEINPKTTHVLNIFYPYPGLALFDEAVKYGWEMPKSLEEWSVIRDDVNLSYINDMWELRSIYFSGYLAFGTVASARTYYQTSSLYELPLRVLRKTAKIRWDKRFFKYPVEYRLLMKIKNLMR